MPIDLSIPSSAAIVLWVEDPLTRDYLGALWGTPTWIAFRVGGGNDGVRAIVESFRQAEHPNVFGLIDRDYQDSNIAKWMDLSNGLRTFILPAHEIENYLLDARSLQASRYQNRNLADQAIEEHMVSKARQLCWWAACRDVIAELKRRFRKEFLPDPKQSVTDRDSARAYICKSHWFLKLATEASRSSETDIHALLEASFVAAGDRLTDGTWRRDFAGKEILSDIAGWMRHRPPAVSVYLSDLAKEIGAWQSANNAIPSDLTDLLAALKARIPPPAPPPPVAPTTSP